MHSGHRQQFICDCNLGRLAKWLRILGFDTLYMKNMRGVIMEAERSAGRIILTRSVKLSSQRDFFLIKSDHIAEQIKEVDDKFSLKTQLRPFSLCFICNEPLVSADNSMAAGHVPEYVLSTTDSFSNCPKCNRFYWQGSHTNRVMETIHNILE
ncbi:MAG TPA: Mut7-C RNAse domain-containing protein [Desulfomonilia bacterium]